MTEAYTHSTPEPTFIKRFVIPAGIALGVYLLLFRTYYSSWYIDNRIVHWLLTDVVGTLYGFFMMFNAAFIYPLFYRLGARPAERVLGSALVIFFWCAKEVYRMTEMFTLGQSFFYLLFPTHFNLIVMAFGLMGCCEMVCRYRLNQREKRDVRVITPLPLGFFIFMIALLAFTNFDGGVTYFFIYNDLYISLFM